MSYTGAYMEEAPHKQKVSVSSFYSFYTGKKNLQDRAVCGFKQTDKLYFIVLLTERERDRQAGDGTTVYSFYNGSGNRK